MFTAKALFEKHHSEIFTFEVLSMHNLLRLNVSLIPVQIVESRGAPSSYAVLKKFHGLAWLKF